MGGAILKRPDRALFALLLLAPLSLPALASSPAACPDGATWNGQPPPLGAGYQCTRTDAQGRMQRHGWAVLFHADSEVKREECEYRDGVRHGRCSFFDESGALAERGSFERGTRTGAWWYWSIPAAEGRRASLALPLGDPAAASARRGDVQSFLIDLGADAVEAAALGEVLLAYVDRDGVERRQVCGAHLCVGPGRIPTEPIYVGLPALPEQVERDRKLLASYEASARKRVRDEERAAKREEERELKEQRRLARQEAREEAQEVYVPEPRECCRVCSVGKPCGDSCIARSKTCRVGRGCAC